MKVKEYKASYAKKAFGFLKSALLYAFNCRYVDQIYGSEHRVLFTVKSEFIYLK